MLVLNVLHIIINFVEVRIHSRLLVTQIPF